MSTKAAGPDGGAPEAPPEPPSPSGARAGAMTPERWRQVRRLFDEALERDPESRGAFVRAAAAGDDELISELESLLAAHAQADDRFEQPAAERLVTGLDDLMPGRRIGSYSLVREIGRGGMGTVFEAVRADDQFRMRVAVKLIKRGMDSDLVIRRFRQERQILAGLDHPNIAGLLDGGVTDDGQPFFVLEFVEGRSITEFCADRQLSVRDRLELFLRVCAPVGYAHQKLVVHRDLKPTNILVTDDGSPKLLDFGVAKLLRAGDASGATLTQAGFAAFTPEYASPEQIRGEQITTAADIYSLGVLLYELLTGQRPFRLRDRGMPDVARIVGEQVPTRPSAAARGATLEQTPPGSAAQLRRQLQGELDSIVMMAIAKEPNRRYSSVDAFAEDVRRFLDGRPVLARQGSWRYHAGKFIGRHRVSVAAAAAVFASAGIGSVATVVQWRNAEAARALAEQRFRDVRSLANSLLFEVHDAIEPLPGATAARALLVQRSVEYLDRLFQETGGDATLEREIAEAYLKLASVQGDPTNANLGDLASARLSLDRALLLGRNLVDRSPRDPQARLTLALAHEKRGDVEAWAGDIAAGVDHLRQALEIRRAMAEAQPDSLSDQLRLVIARIKLGDLLGHPGFPNAEDRAGAMKQYRQAMALLAGLGPEQANVQAVRRRITMVHERIGRMLETDGQYSAALAELTRSQLLRAELAREFPSHVQIQRDAGIARERLCSVYLHLGEHERALDHCEAALATYRRLEAADPSDRNAHMTRAIGQRWLARVLAARGQLDAALEQIEQSSSTLDELAGSDPDNQQLRQQVARTRLHSSLIHARLADAGHGDPGDRQLHQRAARQLYDLGRAAFAAHDHGIPLSEADRELLAEAGTWLNDAQPRPGS